MNNPLINNNIIDEKKSDSIIPAPGTVSRVRTMGGDIALMQSKDNSAISSELLRNERIRETSQQQESSMGSKKIIYILFACLLVACGGWLLFVGVSSFIPESIQIITRPRDPSLYAPLVIDNLATPVVLDGLDIKNISPKIIDIIRETKNNETSVIGIPLMIENKSATVKNILFTNNGAGVTNIIADQNIFYGIVYNPVESPFLVITLPTYDTGYTVMNAWTKTIVRDIGIWMLVPDTLVNDPVATYTSKMELVQNRDITHIVPVIKKPVVSGVGSEKLETGIESISTTVKDPEPLFSWTFLDQRHILVTRFAETIPEITRRFYERQGRTGN